MQKLKIKFICKKCGKGYFPWNRKQKYCSVKCKYIAAKGGNAGSFKKGHISKLRIKKGQRISPATEFKKGHKPLNWCKVGTIKKRLQEGKRRINFIKVSEPDQWIQYSRYVWQKRYGKIPKGKVIVHKDFDASNNRILNLKLCTRAESIKMHKEIIDAFNSRFYSSKYANKNIQHSR